MKIIFASTLLLFSMLYARTTVGPFDETIAMEYTASDHQFLDTLSSYIEWNGCKLSAENSSKNAGCHTGTLHFSDGSITMDKNGNIIEGSATINMHSLTATDLSGSFKKMLETHLKDEDFFHVESYPSIAIEIKEVRDATIETVISVLGIEFQHTIPYVISKQGQKVVIESDCSLNFKGLPTKGFNAQRKKEISSLFSFKIHLEFIA